MDIEKLIPQRAPIRMVDTLDQVEGDVAFTSFMIKADNFFLEEDGLIAEPGLIEHIAQSASAFAGYKAIQAGAEEPPIGYIGEVKRFSCHRRPAANELLKTEVKMGPEVNGVTILFGTTKSGEETIAETQMKIFVEP